MVRDIEADDAGDMPAELAGKLAQFSEEKLDTFHKTINLVYGDEPAPHRFQHAIADELLKTHEQGMQEDQLDKLKQSERNCIEQKSRRERTNDAYANEGPIRPPHPATMDQFMPRGARKSGDDAGTADEPQQPHQQPDIAAPENAQPEAQKTKPDQDSEALRFDREAAQALSLLPNTHAEREQGTPHIYAELKQQHLASEQAKTVKTPIAPEPAHADTATTESKAEDDRAKADRALREKFTPDVLDTMMGRYDQLAHQHDLYIDAAQANKQNELDQQHSALRKAEGKDGHAPASDQNQYDPADHLKLAQDVSTAAGYYAFRLRNIDPAQSARLEHESQQTYRLSLVLQRDIAATRKRASPQEIVERQDQDAKTKAQDAGQTGQTLTDADRAAASPEVKSRLESKGKADAKDGAALLSKDDQDFLRSISKDTSRDTGRGGGRGG